MNTLLAVRPCAKIWFGINGSRLVKVTTRVAWQDKAQILYTMWFSSLLLGVCLSNNFGCALKEVHRVLYLWNTREELHDEQNVSSLRTESDVLDATVTVGVAAKRSHGACGASSSGDHRSFSDYKPLRGRGSWISALSSEGHDRDLAL